MQSGRHTKLQGNNVSVTHHEDPSGYLVYENSKTGRKARVWVETLEEIADICKEWHGGKRSPCYRLMSGDWSYENLKAALVELQRALRGADEDESVRGDEDDYIDLATAVEDLDGIVKRIAKAATS